MRAQREAFDAYRARLTFNPYSVGPTHARPSDSPRSPAWSLLQQLSNMMDSTPAAVGARGGALQPAVGRCRSTLSNPLELSS